MKQIFSLVRRSIENYLQPAVLALICGAWVFLQGKVPSEWIFLGVSLSTLLVLPLFEVLFERNSAWRSNGVEFATDFFYVLIGSAIIFLAVPVTDPYLGALGERMGTISLWPGEAPLLARCALAVLVSELCQYWVHRLMHSSPLWRVHAPHHHIERLNAWKNWVGHPFEIWLISLNIFPIFGAGADEVMLSLNLISTVNYFGHGNIAGDPPKWFKFVFTTLSAHSVHHSVVYADTRTNYATTLILLDRIFGTFKNGEADPEKIGQGSRQRLSIPQQLLFPFRRPENVEKPVLTGFFSKKADTA